MDQEVINNKIKDIKSSKKEKIDAFIQDKSKTKMSFELNTFPERIEGLDGWKNILTSYFKNNGQNVKVSIDSNSGKKTTDYDYVKDENGQNVKKYYVRYIASIEKMKETPVETNVAQVTVENVKSTGTSQEVNVTTPVAIEAQVVEKPVEKIVEEKKEVKEVKEEKKATGAKVAVKEKEKVKTEPIMKKEGAETLSKAEETRYITIINKYEKKKYSTFKKVADIMKNNKSKAKIILKAIDDTEEYLKSENPTAETKIDTINDMIELSIRSVK
jgi:hypothetical protein